SRDPNGSTLGAPLHLWLLARDGTVVTPSEPVTLPRNAMRVTAPTTVSIGGDEVRVTGAPLCNNYVVLGQSLDGVAQAQTTTIRAEFIVGAVLLVLVFFGAL